MVNVGEGHSHDKHWSQSVEQNLERRKKGLTGNVAENNGLKLGGQIGVIIIIAKVLVVQQMVWAKASTVGNSNRQIGKDGKKLVMNLLLERKVMRHFVDGEEDIVAARCANKVGTEPELP